MKTIRNITEAELCHAAKKKKHKDATYDNGFLDGAECMRQKAIKENISLRENPP